MFLFFSGNFEYDTRLEEVERMFSRFGKLDHVAMKTGKHHVLP
jgi:hypothetical protein